GVLGMRVIRSLRQHSRIVLPRAFTTALCTESRHHAASKVISGDCVKFDDEIIWLSENRMYRSGPFRRPAAFVRHRCDRGKGRLFRAMEHLGRFRPSRDLATPQASIYAATSGSWFHPAAF